MGAGRHLRPPPFYLIEPARAKSQAKIFTNWSCGVKANPERRMGLGTRTRLHSKL